MENNSVSVENIVKAIYSSHTLGENVKTGTLAEKLNVSAAAITDISRKLSAKGIIDYEKYKGLSLTMKGRRIALNVIRKHRLWETFLHETLGLSLTETHDEAENLEHQTSDFLADKLSEYLGHPDKDPHGQEIPEKPEE